MACMEKKRNEYKILGGKLERKRSLRRPKSSREDIIKINLEK
jgi:hypothetical protein